MENCDLVPFDPKPSQFMLSNEDEALLLSYPMPQPGQCVITQAIMEPKITSRNYCNRLHELLQIEEMAQFEQLSRSGRKMGHFIKFPFFFSRNSESAG